MADKAMNVNLNDDLAGATLGSNLAEQIQAQNEGHRARRADGIARA